MLLRTLLILHSILFYYSQLKELAYNVALERERTEGKEVPPSWRANGTAGKDWLTSFTNRYAKLSLRKAEDLGAARAAATNDTVLVKYYATLKKLLDDNGIMNDATRITNCDEKGLMLNFKNIKSYHRKGAKHCYQVSQGSKAQITVLECGNAAGKMCPPGVLFSGKNVNSKLVKSAPHPTWGIFFSESGWMNGEVFEQWFERVYLPYVETIRSSPDDKVILLLDGHKSHETIKMIELAREHNVVIFCIAANMTHILQPLDVGYFKALQSYWDTVVHRMCTSASKGSKCVTRETFCQLFKEAREKTIAARPEKDKNQAEEDDLPPSQDDPNICVSIRNAFRYVTLS